MMFFFPFHLVSVSPWPLFMSILIFLMMLSLLIYLTDNNFYMLIIMFLLMFLIMFQWWRDIIRESTYQGFHSILVSKGLRLGMFLFILSELMFFISFFWTYFHLLLSPSVEVGMLCPPMMINLFNPYNIPLLNTVILLTSGFTITFCHHCLMNNNFMMSILSLLMTLLLGLIFSFFQMIEYMESFFTMTDSMYGSIFFLATGFHGLHVLIGSMFIMISLIRLMFKQMSMYHYFGFEACSWYWHFVDVVWLFLYLFMYWLIY